MITAQYFIFDMDGLMIDSEKVSFEIWKEVMAANNFNLSFEFYKTLIGLADVKMDKKFYEEFGADIDYFDLLKQYDIKKLHYYRNYVIELKLGLIQLLEHLKARNYKMAVATSSNKETADLILKKVGIYDYFAYFITSNDIEHHKPNPDVFLKALSVAGETKENSIVLEDSTNGLKAAHSAGIKSIFIKDLLTPPKEVLDNVYLSFKDLSECIKYIE